MAIRRCSVCKKHKPIEEFGKNPRYKSGYCYECKPCKAKWARENSKTPRNRFTEYRKHAKRRGIDFELGEGEFRVLFLMDCVYCGEPGPGGVDRVDSSKGYTVDNVLPCCTTCNRMKLAHSTEKWFTHMAKILSHYHEIDWTE